MALPFDIATYGAVIAPGASLSASISTGAYTLVGIWMPPVWTAAALTFQVSLDGVTWSEVYDDTGAIVTVAAPPAGAFVMLSNHPNSAWRGINMIRVRSGTLGSPVTQSAGATVNLICRPETV